MPEPETPSGRQPRLRALLYVALALGIGVGLLAAMTWFVIGAAPRSRAVALRDGLSVREFAALPDADAYPAALAIDADGKLYTGSYATGAIWSISPAGDVRELPGSRERIGSVTGLDLAPDGALYVLDRIAPLDAQGALVWRYFTSQLERLFDISPNPSTGGPLADDIAVDKRGLIYISDRLGHVLRYSETGAPMGDAGEPIWWRAPCREDCEITGLAYDRANDQLLVAEPGSETILRLAELDRERPRESSLYRSLGDKHDYGFDGIHAADAGEVFVSLLNWNRVARVEAGALVMLAKDFRGASDLAFDAQRKRLYVANWNQFSLAFGTRPQLPFAIDVIDFAPDA